MSDNANATTDYGTWYTINGDGSDKPRDVILNVLGDQADGYDVDAIEREYRSAINAALPGSVTLAGTLFYGPYERPDWEAAGYPVDPMGTLDIKAIIDGIDVIAIAAKHDWGMTTPETDPAAALRAERAELIARLVDVHRRTLAAPARINYGDALDLSLRTGGVASMRRHGRRVGLAVVNGHLPDSLDPDEAEEVALSLLAAGVNGLLAAPDVVEVVEVADDARAARLRTAYETGNHDADGGPW